MIVSNINKIRAKHKNEDSNYEYYKYEVVESKDKLYNVLFYKIPPQKSGYPFHYHEKNNEVFYIISGEGILRTNNERKKISNGDVIVCESGEEGAHEIINISKTDDLVYIEFDTINFPEIIKYPDTKKIGVFIDDENKRFYKEESSVGYYE